MNATSDRDGRIIDFGVPSKGRLMEATYAHFAQLGAPIRTRRGARDYTGELAGVPGVTVHFLQAAEIAARLSDGSLALGVTGDDLLGERGAREGESIHRIAGLGFGHADLVVAVPKSWIDVDTMADLDSVAHDFRQRHGRRMRVATKYFNLTHGFFARHHVADYRIVESLGATEGAPRAGTAEMIVDITSTGQTLEANDLKVLSDGVILASQAALVASLHLNWTPARLSTVRPLLDRANAADMAKGRRLIDTRVPAAAVDRLTAAIEAAGGRVLMASEHRIAALMADSAIGKAVEAVRAVHGEPLVVMRPDAVFDADNPLYEGLVAAATGP